MHKFLFLSLVLTINRQILILGIRDLAMLDILSLIVWDMDVTTYEEGQGLCEDCIMEKHTRQPFNDNPTQESDVLERVYIDL
jgi:hypothetical protein